MRDVLMTVLAAAVLAGCSDNGGEITIDDRTGTVEGLAYIDRDGSGTLNLLIDAAAAGVSAALLLEATGDTVAQATSGADGSFSFARVNVGRYRLVARRGALGDSVVVVGIDSASFSLAAGDTILRFVRLGYPVVSVAEARALPVGRRVVLEGIALNAWANFGDSTVHVQDASGAIRAVRAPLSPVQAGDSVRVLGTVGTSGGRTVVADASVQVVVAARGLPPIDSLATGAAATAEGGSLADRQARIAGAVILDTARVGADLVIGADDGSGRVDVVLDGNVAFAAGPYLTGATLAATGVLVPGTGAGTWRIKPRERAEVNVTFPTVTIAAARALQPGLQVAIVGIALNATAAFADSTVHVRDATGALRTVRVQGAVAAGDSVRLLGSLSTRDGQPVLTGASATVLRAGVGVPAPDSLATAAAAAASGGLDADFVRIGGTIVGQENVPGGDLVVTVDDGSGHLQVVFDRDISFATASLLPGSNLRAAGVLVPTGAGAWQLKPRTNGDFTATFPSVTVAEARLLAPGRTVYVRGVALNGWVTFGDSTVHVQDPTAAIRVVRLPSSQVFAGDSVRILGTTALRDGQPVLTGASANVLLTGVGLPVLDSLSTAAAAAAGSSRDAEQAAVHGTVTTVGVRGADVLLTVTDGSGPLAVLLDRDAGFVAGNYSVGDVIRIRGLLVPAANGSTWELKPRTLAEVAVNAP